MLTVFYTEQALIIDAALELFTESFFRNRRESQDIRLFLSANSCRPGTMNLQDEVSIFSRRNPE